MGGEMNEKKNPELRRGVKKNRKEVYIYMVIISEVNTACRLLIVPLLNVEAVWLNGSIHMNSIIPVTR